MGGRVFADHIPPIPTPRLTPAEYVTIRNTLCRKLAKCYERVAVPIEAPEKDSYGDVDIIVCGPRYVINEEGERKPFDPETPYRTQHETFEGQLSILEQVLEPVARCGSSFAVPKTVQLFECVQDNGDSSDITDSTDSTPTCCASYVQVDIGVLPRADFDWDFFMHCHGDIWNMLGPSLRRVGLVLTDLGFFVINPEIERVDKKRARVLLSRDLDTILSFIGLNASSFWGTNRANLPEVGECRAITESINNSQTKTHHLIGRSFASLEDLFAFASSSRFFDPTVYVRREEDLKANDRKRLIMRGTYRRFCEEWVPRHYPDVFEDVNSASEDEDQKTRREEDRRAKNSIRRTAVAKEALAHFGRRQEWEEREQAFREERKGLALKRWRRELLKDEGEWVQAYAKAWMDWLQTPD